MKWEISFYTKNAIIDITFRISSFHSKTQIKYCYKYRKRLLWNYNQIKRKIGDKEILPILKASGYGIGAKNVKKFLDKVPIERIGTALVDEAIVLRAGLDYKRGDYSN